MTCASFIRTVGLLLSTCALAACASWPGDGLAGRIKGHVAFLSDDALGGRDTGSEGFDIAAEYVAAFYEGVGLEPAVEDYRQPVPLRLVETSSLSGSLSITTGDETMDLVAGESFFALSPNEGVTELQAEASGDLVFVGHGIAAPALGINDYEGIDVAGKIVVALTGAPVIDDNPSLVHLRRFDVKRMTAYERGAIGFLRVDPRDGMIARFTRLTSRPGRTQMSLGDGLGGPTPAAVLGVEPLKTLFEAQGRDFDTVVSSARDGENVSFDLSARATLTSAAKASAVNAYNVVGLIPGTDPELAGEAVVVTAHLDHVGMRDDGDPKTDDINNGAVDNASGTAIIMEAARAIMAKGGARRTIIFASVTAEEKGLLGAAHLARNIDALGYEAVANVNIDMPVLTYPLNDIIAFGAEYSTLGAHFDDAAAEVDLVASPDPLPELGLFARSDHYRFVQQGIPALFLFNGMSGEGKANFEAFMATHYHKPSDDMSLPINWRDAATFSRLTADLVTRIANDDQQPEWNEGVVFKKEGPQG